MRDSRRSSERGSTLFAQLKRDYEAGQQAKQAKKDRQAATKQKALEEMIGIVDPILQAYGEARAIDGHKYKVTPNFKPNSRSLGYEKDGIGWLSIADVAPQFDAEGNIEHLYVSLGKSINSPEPWSICQLSEAALVSTIEELHRKQHS